MISLRSNLMIERYTLPEMGAIWTEENKFRKWLEVEIAACQANAEAGSIPMDAAEIIRQKAAFSVERIHELEKSLDHDVIAFTTNLAENIGPQARWLHYGLTSSDHREDAGIERCDQTTGIRVQKDSDDRAHAWRSCGADDPWPDLRALV
jgi:adenylosuccinate lyase